MEGHLAQSSLPGLLVLVPLVGSLLVPVLGRRSETLRNWFSVIVSAVTFLGAAALIPLVAEHHEIASEVPLLFGHITFRVDTFGMLFALFTSFVWLLSTLYATGYMQHEHKRDRYFAFNLAILAANMGVVLAGDLVSLYLFFEALGILSFMLVIHAETDEAKRAAVKYIWMTIVGGLAVIGGILLTFGLGSQGAIGPFDMHEASEVIMWTAALLMIVGFGVKAGMLPVHVWLPDAHPVAPTPASALLSGVMIKAGAYGIFRVVTAVFRPEVAESVAEELWQFSSEIGLVVLWFGIATMFVGVVLALLQDNAKRMLAYSSISQMGFILLGIGAAGYLGAHGAMGYAGGLFHIVNHSLFKAGLFLGIGAVFYRTGQLDMYKLGGLWRRMPLTFAFTLVAACGYGGVPLFNGFVSKSLLHHALVESAELHHLVSLQVAEWVFILTCAGSACLLIKLIKLVFLGKPRPEFVQVREAPVPMLLGMGGLAAAIVTLGLAPGLLLDGVLVPGLHAWGLHADLVEQFTLVTGENLLSVVYAFAGGALAFVVGMRYNLFHLQGPRWLSVDYWYVRTARGSVGTLERLAVGYDAYRGFVSRWLARGRRALLAWALRTQRRVRRAVVTLSTGAPLLRQQHITDAACIMLERERHATVRDAVLVAVRNLEALPDASELERKHTIDAVREIASEIAFVLFDSRMAVVGRFVRSGRVEALKAVLDTAVQGLRESRRPVAETAIRLAEPRTRGENVARAISMAAFTITGTEDFDRVIRDALVPTSSSALHPAQVRPWMSAPIASAHERVELGGLERLGAWLSSASRILSEAIIQERFPWMIEERLDREDITSIRLAVKRYVRDTSFNVAMVVFVFMVFAFAAVRNS